MNFIDYTRVHARLHEAAELIRDVQHQHPLELSGVTITVASMAIHDIELLERRLLEEVQ
jgi:hypothetical protein